MEKVLLDGKLIEKLSNIRNGLFENCSRLIAQWSNKRTDIIKINEILTVPTLAVLMITCEFLQLYFSSFFWIKNSIQLIACWDWTGSESTSASIYVCVISLLFLRVVERWQQMYGKLRQDDCLHRWNYWLPIHKWIKLKYEHEPKQWITSRISCGRHHRQSTAQ